MLVDNNYYVLFNISEYVSIPSHICEMWVTNNYIILMVLKSRSQHLTTICVNVCDRVCLPLCLHAIFSRTTWGMETWMVPCSQKLSGACFKPLRFTKSSQKLSKRAKSRFYDFLELQLGGEKGAFIWYFKDFET